MSQSSSDDGKISLDLLRAVHASRNEAASDSTPAATLSKKMTGFLSAIEDPRAAESINVLLHALVNQILADEVDLDITLDDLTAASFLTTDSGADEMQTQITDVKEEPTNMTVDA